MRNQLTEKIVVLGYDDVDFLDNVVGNVVPGLGDVFMKEGIVGFVHTQKAACQELGRRDIVFGDGESGRGEGEESTEINIGLFWSESCENPPKKP